MEELAQSGQLATAVAWLERKEVVNVMLVNSVVFRCTEWERVFKEMALGRAGTSERRKRDMYQELQSWGALQAELHASSATHHFSCLFCKNSPIDGTLYSCLYCYGKEAVWCQECEDANHNPHPSQHIVLRWPQGIASKAHLHKGVFRYRKLLWKGRVVTPEDTVQCAECHLEMDKLVVQCASCEASPTLCPSCALGDRAALGESTAGKQLLTTLTGIEGTGDKVYLKKGSESRHIGHTLLFYPHIKFPERNEDTPHRCTCNVCDKSLSNGTIPRFRCAICVDYDRCLECFKNKKPHKHPMLVLQYPAQRQQITQDTPQGLLGVITMQADNAFSSSSEEEEDEEEEDEEDEDASD